MEEKQAGAKLQERIKALESEVARAKTFRADAEMRANMIDNELVAVLQKIKKRRDMLSRLCKAFGRVSRSKAECDDAQASMAMVVDQVAEELQAEAANAQQYAGGGGSGVAAGGGGGGDMLAQGSQYVDDLPRRGDGMEQGHAHGEAAGQQYVAMCS